VSTSQEPLSPLDDPIDVDMFYMAELASLPILFLPVSHSAALATAAFNQLFYDTVFLTIV
jgi:hypothetical protein